jgi:nicotinamide phosphoribosyltransferase
MSLQRQITRKLERAIADKDWNSLEGIQKYLTKIITKPDNLILCSDGYKYSHHKFYGVDMTKMISYMESRGGKFSETVFYGLQIFLKQYLEGVAITKEEVDEANDYLGSKLGIFGRDDVFDRSKFDYIVDKYDGKLPISIKAVPEGTVVNTKNVLFVIESLDENCAWITNFLESILLQVWYPITVATLSREVRKIVTKSFIECTSYDSSLVDFLVDFVLNDFGFRGVSSVQSAKIGGSAHLVNFRGSDTVVASKLIRDIYNTDTIYGLSIPATEHSIMTLNGEEGELDLMMKVLKTYPTGLVACVSDSFNIFRACSQYWGTELRDLVLSRPATPGNQLVIRPDSGHVLRTLKEIFDILFDKFGYTVNEKGYKVLPPQVRVIQGDGVNLESISEIYAMLKVEKISPENLALGMGGKLLQADINRDTNNFATKACFAIVNKEERNIVKSPTEMDENGNITKSFKKSKQGKLKLVKSDDGSYRTVTSMDADFDTVKDELVEVFRMGDILIDWTFEEIRQRAKVLFEVDKLENEVI